jgi:O-antigen ligase
MDVPYREMNGWRIIAIWGSVWALVCALWVGITRRTSILAMLVSLEVNAFVFAVFGILQRASGAPSIYGVRSAGHPDFLAAIIYRNHAAAFFSLLASVGLGLTIRAFWKGRTKMDPSGPGIIHLLLALTLVVALVLSGSFAAMGLFTVMLAALLPVVAWRYSMAFRGPGGDTTAFIAAVTLIILACGLGIVVGFQGLRDRVDSFARGGGNKAARIRLLSNERSFEMFGDRWALGWGAGTFRYGFTKYQKREPELSRIDGLPVHWEHVHDDWLELLVELGVLGAIPVACIVVFWIQKVAQLKLWRKLPALPMLGGLVILAVHGMTDFPFQNLAVLASASALLPLLIRWGEFEVEAT